MTSRRRRYYIYASVLMLFAYALMEIGSYLGLVWLIRFRSIPFEPRDQISSRQEAIIRRALDDGSTYIMMSPELGWTIRPNASTPLYTANSAGIRAEEEYSEGRNPERVRVATFGDSYTHGDEVSNDETWQVHLSHIDSALEVMNFGVGGYGLDQAYLRYLNEGKRYRPDIVVMGFMSANIYRNVNVYRPFHRPGSELPFSKPRFSLENDSLVLIRNPLRSASNYAMLLSRPGTVLPELGRSDHFFPFDYAAGGLDWSPTMRLLKIFGSTAAGYFLDDILVDGIYNTGSDAYRVTVKIFDVWVRELKAQNITPVILIFPNEHDLRMYAAKRVVSYGPLVSFCHEREYSCIDMVQPLHSALDSLRVRDLFNGVHYSGLANRVVALALDENLRHLLAEKRIQN